MEIQMEINNDYIQRKLSFIMNTWKKELVRSIRICQIYLVISLLIGVVIMWLDEKIYISLIIMYLLYIIVFLLYKPFVKGKTPRYIFYLRNYIYNHDIKKDVEGIMTIKFDYESYKVDFFDKQRRRSYKECKKVIITDNVILINDRTYIEKELISEIKFKELILMLKDKMPNERICELYNL